MNTALRWCIVGLDFQRPVLPFSPFVAAGAEDMTGAVGGGSARRYLRQYAAAVVLGFMFMGVIAVRFALHDPVRGAAVAVGIAALDALANLLGRCSRTPRTSMSLFLFGLYVAVYATRIRAGASILKTVIPAQAGTHTTCAQ